MFVNIFSFPFSEQWNEAYSAQCYAVINEHPNYLLSPVPVSQMAGAGPLKCNVSRVHTLAYPAVRRNIRYLIFIRRVHYVLHTIQSHSAGLSLPPCLRARGVYVVWLGAAWGGGGLARPRDPDPGAAAAANGRQPRPGHAQAVARAGTFKTSTYTYCWMKRREIM